MQSEKILSFFHLAPICSKITNYFSVPKNVRKKARLLLDLQRAIFRYRERVLQWDCKLVRRLSMPTAKIHHLAFLQQSPDMRKRKIRLHGEVGNIRRACRASRPTTIRPGLARCPSATCSLTIPLRSLLSFFVNRCNNFKEGSQTFNASPRLPRSPALGPIHPCRVSLRRRGCPPRPCRHPLGGAEHAIAQARHGVVEVDNTQSGDTILIIRPFPFAPVPRSVKHAQHRNRLRVALAVDGTGNDVRQSANRLFMGSHDAGRTTRRSAHPVPPSRHHAERCCLPSYQRDPVRYPR